jgi:hypothetical protein
MSMKTMMQELEKHEKVKSRRQDEPGRTHTQRILAGGALVAVPMVVFTIVILALVFSNILENTACPHGDIRPEQPLVNTTSKSHYYVDYPAARLVWISSFSSTVSFAMIGVIMTMFAYRSAAQLLAASSQPNETERLLSPYQTSLLLRILNSDYFSIWDTILYSRSKSSQRAGKKAGSNRDQRKQTLILHSIGILCLGIFARYESTRSMCSTLTNQSHSVSIQAADAYLHIATKAVEIVSIMPKPADTYKYSRRIGS